MRVWDLPTRLFHWLLALSIIGSVVSIKLGETGWHFRFGYTILTLLLFRLIWGFVGPRYARFSSFPPDLLMAWRSLRGEAQERPGHSAAGALSVYALLLSCSVQAVTGLFSNDGILWDGPLRKWISGSTSDMITGIHLANRIVLIALIVLHVGAIVWYRVVRKKSLTRAMITGDAAFEAAQHGAAAQAARDDTAIRLRALVALAASAAAVWALVR